MIVKLQASVQAYVVATSRDRWLNNSSRYFDPMRGAQLVMNWTVGSKLAYRMDVKMSSLKILPMLPEQMATATKK